MKVFTVVSLVFRVYFVAGYLQEKPPFLRTCYMADPDYPKCITESAQEIVFHLRDGYSHLGIPPLDPLLIPELYILQGVKSPVSFDVKLVDLKITGLSDAFITLSDYDDKGGHILDIKLANFIVEGGYRVKGRILMIPIQGHGDLRLDVEREGHKFFTPRNVKLNFEIGRLKMKLNNLFNGLVTLEDRTNNFINDNWRHLLEYVKPVFTKTVEDQITEVMTHVLDYVPADYFVGDI